MNTLQTIDQQGSGKQRETISAAIDAISESLSIPVDLHAVLQTIVDQARVVAGAEFAALGIVADPERPFEPWVFSGFPMEKAVAIGRHPRPAGLLGAVPASGKTIRLRDLQDDPRFRGWPAPHPEMHSFMGVPIHYRGESVGNLYICNKVGAEEFTNEDQWAVELLAKHTGLALQVAGIDDLRATVEAERGRLRAILESDPHSVLFVESRTRRVDANRAALELLGITLTPEATADQFAELLRYPDGQRVDNAKLPGIRAVGGQTVRTEEYLVVRPDGREVPVLVSSAPVRNSQREVTGAVVVFEDITQMKELEQLREEWSSLIAHDLRQPVTVVTGYTEMLRRIFRRNGASDPALKAIEHIATATHNLNRMIGELLDASRLEASRMTLDRERADLPSLVQSVVERARGTTQGHPVRVDVQGDISPLWIDPGRIEQILSNLLSNAGKYSDPETEIRVRVEGQDGEARVSVTNYGRGIPPEELPQLFTRFHRTRSVTEDHIPGLGLGLYIAKGLVEAHGGRIWAESKPTGTTTVQFTLPTSASPPKAA